MGDSHVAPFPAIGPDCFGRLYHPCHAACARFRCTGVRAPISGQCNAEAARGHVGKFATAATVEAARKDAGASIARTLKPDQMVTMEYMEGRLNVDVDARNVITRVRCG